MGIVGIDPKYYVDCKREESVFRNEEYLPHWIKNAGWSCVTVTTWSEKKAVYRLRADVYDEELRWSNSNYGYEVDMFDEFAHHLVVKDSSGSVVATARIIDHNNPWMASECYDKLYASEALKYRNCAAVEVSRMCVVNTHRKKKVLSGLTIMDLLIVGILRFCMSHSRKLPYFVTRVGMERVLRMRGVKTMHKSRTQRMPDGCLITSFVVDNAISYDSIIKCDKKLSV